jgi:tetratricopeptide (TPR) repeat protein
MDCPFCDEPLIEVFSFSEEELHLFANLPYVIAYPLKRAVTEQHPGDKVNLLKDTFLNYLKYMGLVTASEFFQSPFKDKRMVSLFQSSIAEPSFGTWNHFIRETIAYLEQNNHSFFCPELPKYYQDVETGKKRKLFKGEIEFVDGNGDIQYKKQEATAIGMLINFRNRYLGHGLTLDHATAQKLWDEYYPIFRELLSRMTFSVDYPMYKSEHGETYRLVSDQIQRCEKQLPILGNVWMENPQGESMDILPFFIVPGEVAIAKEDKEQILTYESYTGRTIKFFSPEGTEKQTSGKILERLNILLRDKQKEQPYSPEAFTKEIFLSRVREENALIYETLTSEKKVIPGVYVHRKEIEIELRQWIGARANIFVLAAEAGSGKTNLLVEMQQQYASRDLPTLLIRAGRMEKTRLAEQLCYLLNIDASIGLAQYTPIAGTQESPTIVLIDGLNEAHNAESLWQELFEISQCFAPGSLKFVVSTRANNAAEVNRYSITTEQEPYLFSDSKEKEQQLSAYVHWLTALSMEEMKEAWDFYVKKDKGKFKPLFAFDDLATFDRALYNQLSNPLVLRLFLETYQGKGLPKKGTLHLDVWGDWLASFSEQEQAFFRILAETIWEKGENELLLDDVLNDDQLKAFFTTDQLNAPYPRLRNLGWISRYVKDLNACVGLTVEGALLYLLGKRLKSQEPPIELSALKELLRTGSKIQKAGVGNYLEQLALQGDLSFVCELIDLGEEYIDVCTTPIVLHLKTSGVHETLNILLRNPTENDWLILLKVDEALDELTLHPLRKEIALEALGRSDFSSKAAVQYGLKGILLIDREVGEDYLARIDESGIEFENDAELINILGDIFARFANYDKSLVYYEKCLAIKLKTVGQENRDLASSFDRIGTICIYSGEYDKAIENLERCLVIQLKTLGEEHQDVATSYSNIGSAWKFKGEYDKALEFHEKSLAIRLGALGQEHPDFATSYNNIGTICFYKGEYDKAIEIFKRCLVIQLKTLGQDHSNVGISYRNIGVIWRAKGEYDKALECLEKCLIIELRTFGNVHPNVAATHNSIGTIFYDRGEYDKALEFYEKSLFIQIKLFGHEHPEVALSNSNIGSIWNLKGDYDKALNFHERSLAIRLKYLGNRHPDVATSYNHIGLVLNSKGEFDRALNFHEKSLAIRLKSFGKEHPDVATLYSNIGLDWNSKGDYDKALEFYKKCLDIQLKALGEEHPDVAKSYNIIGNTWHSKGVYDKAIEFYEKCLVIKLETYGHEHADVATLNYKIGDAWNSIGEYDKALTSYKKCLEIRLITDKSNASEISMTYLKIGNCFKKLQHFNLAIDSYSKGFEIKCEDDFPYKIAQCYEELLDFNCALDYFIKSAEIRKQNIGYGRQHLANQESILAALRLAKQLRRELVLPKWMIEK